MISLKVIARLLDYPEQVCLTISRRSSKRWSRPASWICTTARS